MCVCIHQQRPSLVQNSNGLSGLILGYSTFVSAYRMQGLSLSHGNFQGFFSFFFLFLACLAFTTVLYMPHRTSMLQDESVWISCTSVANASY